VLRVAKVKNHGPHPEFSVKKAEVQDFSSITGVTVTTIPKRQQDVPQKQSGNLREGGVEERARGGIY
jgi:hypothetical protein